VGIPAPLAPGSETTLDIELLSAAAPGLKSIDVYEGGAGAPDILSTSAAALGPKGRHPEAISISIVVCELFLKLKGGKQVVRSANEVYALAAAAGISVFGAAGDHGSTGCSLAEILPVLVTSFPASSPWVTAVGGTNLRLDRGNRIVKERVWNDAPVQPGGGGGGLSRIGARPFYQGGARYHQLSKRRMVPDISGLADVYPGYEIFCSAQAECLSLGWLPIGGTSVSTPLNAGGVVLANQLAREAGQPPLGFINPLLYRLGRVQGRDRVFNVVVEGNNNLSESLSAPVRCCTATKSWDRASGWGSIRFPSFVRAALAAGG
jgi:kumamolisin